MTEGRCDVVVVGAGGAGLAAAIEAKAAGADVVLLEKNPAPGGSTSWSIGSITSSNTPHQRRKGIVDDPVHHWEDMPGFNGDLDPRDNPALRRILCDNIPDAFQWLLDSGVRFYGPMPEPPHRQPRMHNVLPNSRSFIYHLERRARRAGVKIISHAKVTGLIEKGAAIGGVRYERSGRDYVLEADAVILTAGDFTSSPDLKARFMGPQEAKVEAVNVTATGDGQMLAETAGGRVVNGDLALGPELRFVPPAKESFVRRLPPWRVLARFMEWSLEYMPPVILRPFMMKFLTTALAPSLQLFEDGAILVNARGERFCEERDRPAFRLPDEPGKVGYIVIDARIAAQYEAWPRFISTAPGIAYAYLADYRRNRPDVFTMANDLEGLATRLGMDPLKLAATVSSHNVTIGERDEKGGRNSATPPIGPGPYVALGPVRAVFVHAEGGVMVDTEHRVLDADDRPIAGLYAAGSTGQGGLLLKGHGHHLAWAFVSGRRAGRIAARARA
jgi:succinate dehydrogenase/fumarate reductase flavoprotein subunit